MPENLQALTQPNVHVSGTNLGPYLKAVPSDPWGNPYDYRLIDKKTFTIRSRGADGQADTPDDVSWPEAPR